MHSLQRLIEQGHYELVAHRLVLAVVQTHVERWQGRNARAAMSASQVKSHPGQAARMESRFDD